MVRRHSMWKSSKSTEGDKEVIFINICHNNVPVIWKHVPVQKKQKSGSWRENG